MKLDLPTLAGITRAAGFAPPDVAEAMAVAVVSSGALTNYHHHSGVPYAGDWRGLWAIDVDRHPDLADRDLFDPAVNARTARQLCDWHDGWVWSAPHRQGRHAAFTGLCATATTQRPGPALPDAPYVFDNAARRIGRARDRYAAVAAAAARRPIRRGR